MEVRHLVGNTGEVSQSPIASRCTPDLLSALLLEIERERTTNRHLLLAIYEERSKAARLEELLGETPTEMGAVLQWCEIVMPYPAHVRKMKIERYKEKLRQRRARLGVSRSFTGRSSVARSKPRVHGRFVKVLK